MSIKENKKGFTLVELLAVIVVLAVVILIAVTAVIPRMNNAKKKALADEALVYLKAAKEAYSFDPQLLNASSCTNVTELNGKYVKKDSDNYKGAIKTTYSDGVVSQTIYLTDGKFYVSGSDTITSDNVSDEKPAGFLNSCGDYNPILAGNVDTNSLLYKSFMFGFNNINDAIDAYDGNGPNPNIVYFKKMEDNYGASYQIQGDYRWGQQSQFVVFGGFCWNISRINGDGSIRLLYDTKYTGGDCGISSGSITNIIGGDIYIPYIQEKTYTVNTDDISGLTNNKVQTNYTNSGDGIQYGGYMYDTPTVLTSYPSYEDYDINTMTRFIRDTFVITSSTDKYYFFSSDDINKTCSHVMPDGSKSCTFTCRTLGEDCLYATVSDFRSSANYIGLPPNQTWLFKYDNPKYFCASGSTPVTVENSDGTTSVYMSCTSFYEYVGSISKATGWLRKYYFAPETVDSLSSNRNDSYVKQIVDDWYETNIYNKKDSNAQDANYLEDYIVDQVFCNNRSLNNNTSITYNVNSYSAENLSHIDFSRNKEASLRCGQSDSFTLSDNSPSRVSSTAVGNKMLKYPVGLLSYDEVYSAKPNKSNDRFNYHYFDGAKTFWTMSPDWSVLKNGLQFGGSSTYINVYGYHSGSDVSLPSSSSAYIKPVINIRGDAQVVSGSGFFGAPYIITLPSE